MKLFIKMGIIAGTFAIVVLVLFSLQLIFNASYEENRLAAEKAAKIHLADALAAMSREELDAPQDADGPVGAAARKEGYRRFCSDLAVQDEVLGTQEREEWFECDYLDLDSLSATLGEKEGTRQFCAGLGEQRKQWGLCEEPTLSLGTVGETKALTREKE